MTNNYNCLYIHIPFCDHICTYCDFYKKVSKKEKINKYILYLEKEMIFKKELLKNINVIYIGGGTPSSIGLNNLNILFNSLRKYINFDNIIEFSIECNPIDITDELVTLLIDNKVNRISLGIQSLNDDKLKILGRNHTKKDVINSLRILNKYNFDNINADIMYALPNDDFDLIKNDLEQLMKYNVKHFSCYSLILEEKTILYNKYNQGQFELFDEDEEASLYYKIQEFLSNHNYKQYELSNYCMDNYQCLYNLNTWNNNNYLGIGTSASYYIDNKRYTNIKNTELYFESLDDNKMLYFEEQTLTKQMIMYEEIMLGLRKTKGININLFNNKFNCDIFKTYPNINFLLNNKLLILEDDYLFINEDKLYISNSIINKILD